MERAASVRSRGVSNLGCRVLQGLQFGGARHTTVLQLELEAFREHLVDDSDLNHVCSKVPLRRWQWIIIVHSFYY